MRFWLLTEISLLWKVSWVGLYSNTVSDTQSRGILQGIKIQEAYANGICWFTAWTNFSKEWQEAHAFPYRRALARCQVSASKYRIMRDLVKSWLPENFNRENSLLGDILAEVVTVWQKPYTDENIISQHIAKGLRNLIYSEWYLTPLIKSQFLWNSRPWEKLRETDPFLQLQTLSLGIEPALKLILQEDQVLYYFALPQESPEPQTCTSTHTWMPELWWSLANMHDGLIPKHLFASGG